ncbi:alpha/beta hydrolase family esterase [Reyranella sp.]|uniref:extracellular catalytic domain type 1 short-chain-length polyhydroxyalkanoate depolymerase n=1 Tax=Reyranella sp. TaxID=1929291 RepID=UPI003BAD28FE
MLFSLDPRPDMFEALRLTRAGKLAEAMTVLRGGSAETSPALSPAQRAHEGGLPVSIIDLVPPDEPTGAWTHRPAVASSAKPTRTSSFEYHTVANADGSRRFKLYIPAGYDGQPLPLIVMLHGCTQSPEDFAAGTRMNELADDHMFLVAYPEQPNSANPNKCWNWFKVGDQIRDLGEPQLIAEVTRQILRDHAVDEDRVYVAGLSAGGAAAAIMGTTYPDLYAAVGIHSGLACGAARDMHAAFSAMRQGAPAARLAVRTGPVVPTIVFHGDRDTTVNPINGDQASEQASGGSGAGTRVSRGATATGIAFTRTIRLDAQERAIGEQWVLEGLGHAWSGGSAAGSFTDPRGPDASREFVRFFLEHRLSARTASAVSPALPASADR